MIQPNLTVIGGPNGSGKSTLINYLIGQGANLGHYINADDIARNRGLTGDAGALAGQLAADRMREECLSKRDNFAFETVMSHISKVDFMSRAKAAGYRITFYFVATGNPDINVLRVQTRVSMGGHDVPRDRILARYHRSIANLPKALTVCDKTMVFDNSALGGEPGGLSLRPIIAANSLFSGQLIVTLIPPFPVWAFEALHLRQCGYALWKIAALPDGRVDLQFRVSESISAHQPDNSDEYTVHLAKDYLLQAESGIAAECVVYEDP